MKKFQIFVLSSVILLTLSGCIVRNQPQAQAPEEAPVKNNTQVRTSIQVTEKEPGAVGDSGI